MGEKEKKFCIGIDLCSDYSQVSFSKGGGEPVSVEFADSEEKYRIPTKLGKIIGKDEWTIGYDAEKKAASGEAVLIDDLLTKASDKNPVGIDDETVMPIELLKRYIGSLSGAALKAGEAEKADRICITLRDFNISVLGIIRKAVEALGIEKENIFLACHDESYIYYAISRREELYNGDVYLFEYDTAGLTVKRMYSVNERGNRIIMVHTDDFSEDITYDMAQKCPDEYMDRVLLKAATEIIGNRRVPAVYLTGRIFGSRMNFPELIKFLCDRGRVFAGQNMYCKGACFEACIEGGGFMPDKILLACPERITTGIEIKITDRGRDKMLRMVKPGVNWFSAGCSYDFIVDGAKELEVFLSPVNTSEKQLVRVPLTDFPERPDKTTRISVSFTFTSDSRCHMMVKDLGFGEFFKGSGRVINEDLLL